MEKSLSSYKTGDKLKIYKINLDKGLKKFYNEQGLLENSQIEIIIKNKQGIIIKTCDNYMALSMFSANNIYCEKITKEKERILNE